MVLERRKCLASSGIRAPELPLGTDITAYMDCWVEDEIGELNIEIFFFFMGIFCDPLEVCGGLGQRFI